MIETIAVARVLREAVQTPYRNLVTRPTGALVRGRIESTLADTGEWETALLDFSEVELLDLSCADEVVAKLVRHASTRANCCVALRGLHEHLWESIHAVLEHQDLVVAVMDESGLTLLGSVPDDVRHLFEALDATPAAPATLGARLGWDGERLDSALEALLALRLARGSGDGFARLPLA